MVLDHFYYGFSQNANKKFKNLKKHGGKYFPAARNWRLNYSLSYEMQ